MTEVEVLPVVKGVLVQRVVKEEEVIHLAAQLPGIKVEVLLSAQREKVEPGVAVQQEV